MYTVSYGVDFKSTPRFVQKKTELLRCISHPCKPITGAHLFPHAWQMLSSAEAAYCPTASSHSILNVGSSRTLSAPTSDATDCIPTVKSPNLSLQGCSLMCEGAPASACCKSAWPELSFHLRTGRTPSHLSSSPSWFLPPHLATTSPAQLSEQGGVQAAVWGSWFLFSVRPSVRISPGLSGSASQSQDTAGRRRVCRCGWGWRLSNFERT